MNKILMLMIFVTSFVACKMSVKTDLPPAPASIDQVLNQVRNKHYVVDNIGLLSPFHNDSSVNWNIMKEDTTSFFKTWAAKQMSFTVQFNKDSICNFNDVNQSKAVPAVFSVDADPNLSYEEPRSGFKLRLKYNDVMEFGTAATPALLTSSFLITGINENEMILETGQSFNNRKLVLWLKIK